MTRREFIGGGAVAAAASVAAVVEGAPVKSAIAARSVVNEGSAENYRELFLQFLTDTLPKDREVEIPGSGNFKNFVFKGGDGVHVVFPDVVDLSRITNNFGLYEARFASIRFPNAEGTLGEQMFNTIQAATGADGVDIYMPHITNLKGNYSLYTSYCKALRFFFGKPCSVILTWNNINTQVNADRVTIHGTDGVMTWNGNAWDVTLEIQT